MPPEAISMPATLYLYAQRVRIVAGPFAILHWFQLITPFVKHSAVHAEFLGQRDDVVATLQPLHCHLAKSFGVTPDCSLLCHSQFLSLQCVPITSVSFDGFSPAMHLPS